MTAMNKLKEATHEQHKELEKHAMSDLIMNGKLTSENYKHLMNVQYRLHQCMEPSIIELLDKYIPELEYGSKRMKLPALQAEIDKTGDLDLSTPIPPKLESVAGALGAAYVLEGATLGGQMICRKLIGIPAIAQFAPFSYYGIYGESLGDNWKKFSQTLNLYFEEHANELDMACLQACSTFSFVSQLFQTKQERLQTLQKSV